MQKAHRMHKDRQGGHDVHVHGCRERVTQLIALWDEDHSYIRLHAGWMAQSYPARNASSGDWFQVSGKPTQVEPEHSATTYASLFTAIRRLHLATLPSFELDVLQPLWLVYRSA
jgi:hypothetical protein